MAFAGILNEADITAALQACQGNPHRLQPKARFHVIPNPQDILFFPWNTKAECYGMTVSVTIYFHVWTKYLLKVKGDRDCHSG